MRIVRSAGSALGYVVGVLGYLFVLGVVVSGISGPVLVAATRSLSLWRQFALGAAGISAFVVLRAVTRAWWSARKERVEVPGGAQERQIGLLVVHGIGRQARGRSARNLATALQRLHGDLEDAPETKSSNAVAVLDRGDVRVRIYEVYWADLMPADLVKGSFRIGDVFAVGWFPHMNRRAHLYRSRGFLASIATVFLLPFATALSVLYAVLGRLLKRPLDEVVADVTNYVDSAAGAAEDGPLADVAGRILQRFDETANLALAEGCNELQIVGHSLGSVITFHALGLHVPAGTAGRSPAWVARVKQVYTIGSPLEKFEFIWPWLIHPPKGVDAESPPDRDFEWHNFYDGLDPVANRLRRSTGGLAVVNHCTFLSRGGLALAHSGYTKTRRFTSFVSRRVFPGQPLKRGRRPSLSGAGTALLALTAPFLVLSAALLVFLGVSALATVLAGVLFTAGSFLSQGGSLCASWASGNCQNFLADLSAATLPIVFWVIVASIFVATAVFYGSNVATEQHARHLGARAYSGRGRWAVGLVGVLVLGTGAWSWTACDRVLNAPSRFDSARQLADELVGEGIASCPKRIGTDELEIDGRRIEVDVVVCSSRLPQGSGSKVAVIYMGEQPGATPSRLDQIGIGRPYVALLKGTNWMVATESEDVMGEIFEEINGTLY